MSRYRSAKALAACGAVLVLGTACISVPSGDGDADDTLRIGSVLSLTGPASAYGLPARDALVAVIDHANDAGGVGGKQVELVVEDDGTDPTKAVAATRNLSRQNIDAFIGPTSGTSMLAILPVLATMKVPIITTLGSDVIIDPAADWAPYLFTTAVTDHEQIKATLGLAAGIGPRIGVLHSEDALGDYAIATIQSLAGSYNAEVVGAVGAAADATSLAAQVISLEAKGPDVVVLATASPPLAANFTTAWRSAGQTTPLVGGVAIGQKSFLTLAGPAGEGTIAPMVLDVDNPTELLRSLWAVLEEQGVTPRKDFTDVTYTNSFRVLAEAVERGGDSTPEGIIAALTDGTCVPVYTAGDICYTAENRTPLKADVLLKAVAKGSVFVTADR